MLPLWGLGVREFGVAINISPLWGYGGQAECSEIPIYRGCPTYKYWYRPVGRDSYLDLKCRFWKIDLQQGNHEGCPYRNQLTAPDKHGFLTQR